MIDSLLAQMPQGDDLIALVLGALVFMIPIVAILTQHQQRMAKFMREGQQPQQNQDTEALRREVETLRQLVLQQTISIDNLATQQRELAGRMMPTPPIQARLEQEA